MEDFNTDESLVEGSGIENPEGTPHKKTVKAPPSTTASPVPDFQPEFKGKKEDFFRLEQSDNQFPTQDIGATTDDYENLGNIYKGQDINRLRAEYQSNWDRAGNLLARIGTNVVGGMISSVGSVPAIAESIVDDINGKDADFRNSVTDFGDEMKEWARINFPNYRKNPNETWDFSDPAAWLFGGAESLASSLEFLLPSYGFVKGLGAVNKLVQAEKILAKTGANVQKLKMAAKIASGAVFQRNAENLMESSQLVKNTKDDLLATYSKDPSKFEEDKNSQAGKELVEEGREVTPESLASYVAGKAGWEAYRINSWNVVFDALQIAPLFKGLDATTRLGGMRTSSGIKAANRSLLNSEAASVGKLDKVFDITNPFISGVGRSASEGFEEAVNYMGTHRGQNLAAQLTGEQQEGIDTGQLTESAFWGTLGGMVYEGALHGLNRGKSNTEREQRIGEIQNRLVVLKEASEQIKRINESEIPDDDKKQHINNIKAELSLDLGIRAAQAGNTDLLLEQVGSKEFADKLISDGIAEPGDIDKAIAKTKNDILLAEKLYKNYTNTFQFMEGSDRAKNDLLKKSIVADFFVKKNVEQRNKIATELEELKSEDVYLKNNLSRNIENLVELEGLFAARRGINKIVSRSNKQEDQLLGERGKAELESINQRVLKIKEIVGTERLDKEQLNPKIISKQAEMVLMDSTNNIQAYKIKEYTKPGAAEAHETKIKGLEVKADEAAVDAVKKTVEADNTLTVEKLTELKDEFKELPEATKYLDKKIKEAGSKIEAQTKKDNVKAELLPLNDEIGLPDYPAEPYNESHIDSSHKTDIDRLLESKSYSDLEGYASDLFANYAPETVKYTRSKIREIRDKIAQAKETKELNSSVPEAEAHGLEFNEFENHEPSQSSQHTIDDLEKQPVVEDQKDEDKPFEFLAKDFTKGDVCTATIPMFRRFGKEGEGHQDFYQTKNGNILIKDKYVSTVKALFNSELTTGTEVEIMWNPAETDEVDKGNKDNEAFEIVYKGVSIAWLGRVKHIEDTIRKLREAGKNSTADKVTLDLVQIKKLRDKLELSGKNFKTKIAYKGNGTIISRGTRNTDLRSIKGIGTGLYALDSNTYRDRTSLVNLEDETQRISNPNPLKPGKVYMGLKDANGGIIPVPLSVSKLNNVQAVEIAGNAEKLLDLLNQGKDAGNEDVRNLKDAIAKYIRVDKLNNYDKPIGFRVHPQIKKPDGTVKDARIQVAYQDTKGERKIAVIRKGISSGEMWLGIFKDDKRIYEITSGQPEFDKAIRDLFKLKYHNVDFSLLNSKKAKAFEYNDKVYKNYKEYLIEEEILRTDVAQVVDKDGNILSNLFGFNNDFRITIETEIKSKVQPMTEPEKNITYNASPTEVEKTLDNLFQLNGFEKEITKKEALTKDLSYRDRYAVYTSVGISSADAMLDEILANPQNDNIKRVAKWLKDNSGKLKIDLIVGHPQKGALAIFNPHSNTIVVDKDTKFSEAYFQQTVLHELIHGATSNTILRSLKNVTKAYPALKEEGAVLDITNFEFRDNTPDYVKNFLTEILVIRNKVMDGLTKLHGKSVQELLGNTRVFYGLENPMDFISEIMVNPNFRNEVRKLQGEGENLFTRIYNAIVDLLNEFFGTKIGRKEDALLKHTVGLIREFVNRNSEQSLSPITGHDISSMSFLSRMIDKFDGNFTREQIIEITNTLEGFICNAIQKGKVDVQETLEDRSNTSTIRDNIRAAWQRYHDTQCPESFKPKVEKILEYFHTFYDGAISGVNKNFKIGSAYDINLLKENEGLTKNWDDTKAQEISSQDTVTRQIKLFVKTVPEIDNLEHKFDDKGNPLWNRKKSTITGVAKYIDFNVLYPYMIRNLIGARTRAEIVTRLENMSRVNPAFAYIAHEVQKDENLIAQFESNLAKKTVYDSYVTFITDLDDSREIWIMDELKSSRYDYLIADDWTLAVNKKIDDLTNAEAKLQFKMDMDRLHLSISTKAKDFDNNKEAIIDQVYEFSGKLGLDLSLPAIKSVITSSRSWEDVKSSLLDTLDLISGSIEMGRKGDDMARLNSLARIEALYRFDVIENSGLDIKNNLIYAIRNPSFISNWFNDAKSTTKEGRESFEQSILGMSKVPEMQMSRLLWNTKSNPGFLNFEVKDGNKVPKYKEDHLDINWEFVKRVSFHDYGGAKETLSKNTQKYGEFSDNDWKLMNLISYLNLNDKNPREKDKEKAYVLIPSIIASDSGKAGMFEVPKIKLQKTDIYRSNGRLRVKQESELFKAVLNVARGEVRRIQQVTEQLFNIVDNKLTVKPDLDTHNLQQHYHYGKEAVRNQDGTIDWNKTLLNDDGSPKGKAFYFHNMTIKDGNKVRTLDNVEGIKTNHHLAIGEVDKATQYKIINFTENFIDQQIEQAIKDYKSLELEVSGKHENVVDGSFEALMAEYILNHFIYNNEQFLLFNGTIAEYKDKIDTNKRAKQLFTPGVGLSEEAMKITYENGSMGDGATFKAITLKDIKTISGNIDFIVETIKSQLIKERKYSKPDIKNFTLQGAKAKDASKSKNALVRDTHKIIKGYLSINAGDAQGYTTLDRYEALERGRGQYNNAIKDIVEKSRKGETLTLKEFQSLQPNKGFYYGREYDAANNKLTSTQIKYSTIPLIPSMVRGTELEKLMNFMNERAIDEAFFESAHKVGAKNIHQIENENGGIDEEALKKATPNTYLNRNYKIQLDTPEHLLDQENLLAVQISKLIVANLDHNTTYKVNDKDFKASELLKHYFDLWTQNIEESSVNLLKELGIETDDTGYIVKDERIKDALRSEVERRGLSDNYSFAIEIDEQGNFKLPLFVNNMATKWEAILTSIFTDRIIKQEISGGSVVLSSRLFLDKAIEQKDAAIVGIKWSKEKEGDKTLRSFISKDGKTRTVEVLMGGWSKHLYKAGQLMDIDEVPDEVKTMIGYRIPTTSKSYMTVFKVVGFLPEESKGLIVTPDDMVTQMGQDFDIDKWFLINKKFFRTKAGKFIVPRYGTKEEYDALSEYVPTLRDDIYGGETGSKEDDKLADALASYFGTASIKELKQELEEKEKELNLLRKFDKDGKAYYNDKAVSKDARNNEIFEIYKAILTNPTHFKEILTPSGYPNITEISDEIDSIFHESDNNINPLTEAGQREFRSRNISGKNLLGIAANFNGFMGLAQVTKMELNHNIAYKFKFNLEGKDLKGLKARYGKDLQVSKDKKSAVIVFRKLGHAPDGSYLNANGELIMEVGSEGVVAAADNAKDPRLGKLNLSTYTYPTYHAGVSAGVPAREMGLFMRQPIVKALNDFYFDNKSLLSDETGQQIETVKRLYQTYLYEELVRQDPQYVNKQIKAVNDKISELQGQKTAEGITEKKLKDIIAKIKKAEKRIGDVRNTFKNADKRSKDRKKVGASLNYDKRYLVYVNREDTKEVLGYSPDELDVFSVEELREQLVMKAGNYQSLSAENRIKYLRTQLQVIEYFNRWKKAGEALSDMAKVAKTDGIGAGPSMDVTSELIRTVESLKDNERILIGDQPAVTKLYPMHFGLEGESVYPPIEAYFEYGNKLSRDVLSKLFINQTRPFRDVVYTIAGAIKGDDRRTLNEDEVKAINKFLNISILDGFNKFSGLNKEEILGVGKNIVSDANISIEEFRKLSVANKVFLMQQKQKGYLLENPQHILNFLTPVLDADVVKEKGYHDISFLFYKNEFTDDNLADSITAMYETGDDFERDLSESLINYAFVHSGLSYGLRSYAKVIPTEVLYKMGLGTYLRDRQKDLLGGLTGFDTETIDRFFRNNWNNSDFVPVVKTKWDFVKDENTGKRHIRRDDFGNKFTKDRSPVWDASKQFIIVGKKSLQTLPSKIQAAPYISIWTKDGLKLYKKYIKIIKDFAGNDIETEVFDGNLYYYQINKLGKDGITEMSERSMFKENNLPEADEKGKPLNTDEAETISNIENTIAQIKKQSNPAKTENTSKEKKEEIVRECKIKP